MTQRNPEQRAELQTTQNKHTQIKRGIFQILPQLELVTPWIKGFNSDNELGL